MASQSRLLGWLLLNFPVQNFCLLPMATFELKSFDVFVKGRSENVYKEFVKVKSKVYLREKKGVKSAVFFCLIILFC